HVLPAAEAADVVALGGAVLVRRHLQAHHGAGRDVDHHALDDGDVLVADQRVLPALDLRVADHGLHQDHLAGPALVLLEGRDLRRVGRPHQDRAVAVGPAGVVGGVAVVGAAIGGELRLLARGDVAHPQVPVADEGLRLAVRRAHAGLLAALARDLGAAGGVGVAQVAGAAEVDLEAAVVADAELGDRQLVGLDRLAAGPGQRRGQAVAVEGEAGLDRKSTRLN